MKSKLAILMLSWRRFEILLETLKALPSTFSQPVHLILRVQGAEDLTKEQRELVHNAARDFTTTDIYFTCENLGTASPRLDLLHRGAKAGYKYLMFTDDDIIFPPGGIDYQTHILDKYPEVGSISIRPGKLRELREVSKNGVRLKTYKDEQDAVCEVYIVGSASLMFRSTLYLNHLIAPESTYFIGTWDWDFVCQIRSAGYKVCIITNKSITNKRGGDFFYRKVRRNRQQFEGNQEYFMKKWGFNPMESRTVNSDFIYPVTFENKFQSTGASSKDLEEALFDNLEKKSGFKYKKSLKYKRKKLMFTSTSEIRQEPKLISIPSSKGSDWKSRIIKNQVKKEELSA